MGNAYQIKDQEATYYLTFQVVGWADIFSRKVYRDIIIESFEYCRRNKGLEIFAYVIMTNHVHAILRSKEGLLSDIVRDFKKHTSKQILEAVNTNNESRREWLEMIFKYHAKFNKRAGDRQLWTHENHAVELSTSEMIESRINYIHENPVRAGWVENPEDYLYSSARNFSEMTGLIEIDEI
ncbi:MAG: transposase [Bacteroidota bacterium]|nr:MAG: transposase [Bacteroidota bacterium]